MFNINIKGELYNKGRLPYQNILTKVLNKLFGKNWVYIKQFEKDITKLVKVNSSSNILLYYPELIITNEVEHTHLIRNLFVIIQINSHDIGIYGSRGTVTTNELHTSYQHSHLNKKKEFKNFYGFCKGELLSEEFKNFIKLREIKEDNIIYLFSLIDTYLKYESITGVPYICLEEIIYDRVTKLNTPQIIDFDIKNNGMYNTINNLKVKSIFRKALRGDYLIPYINKKTVEIDTKELLIANTFKINSGVIHSNNTDTNVGKLVETTTISKDMNLIEKVELKINKLAYALNG